MADYMKILPGSHARLSNGGRHDKYASYARHRTHGHRFICVWLYNPQGSIASYRFPKGNAWTKTQELLRNGFTIAPDPWRGTTDWYDDARICHDPNFKEAANEDNDV